MTPAKASATAVTVALVLWLLIVAYNAGRYNTAHVSNCEIRGTIP